MGNSNIEAEEAVRRSSAAAPDFEPGCPGFQFRFEESAG